MHIICIILLNSYLSSFFELYRVSTKSCFSRNRSRIGYKLTNKLLIIYLPVQCILYPKSTLKRKAFMTDNHKMINLKFITLNSIKYLIKFFPTSFFIRKKVALIEFCVHYREILKGLSLRFNCQTIIGKVIYCNIFLCINYLPTYN